jgi:rubrerythrin
MSDAILEPIEAEAGKERQYHTFLEQIGNVKIWACKNKMGHRRAKNIVTGREGEVQRLLWEQAYGPIPKGHVIHHIDHNPDNNVLSNLTMLSYKEHKRHHEGWFKIDGEWHKKCPICGVVKPESGYSNDLSKYRMGKCYDCYKKISWEREKVRRAKLRREHGIAQGH